MNNIVASFYELPSIVGFVVFLSIIGILSFILKWFWKNVLIRFAKITATNLDRRIFEATGRAAQIAFVAAGLNFSWDMFGKAIFENFNNIKTVNISFIESIVDHIFFLFLAFSLVILLWNAVMALLDWFEKDVAVKTETTLDEKIIFSVRKMVKALFVIFIVMIITDHFDIKMSKLWAMAGIGSLAVALAAKDTFANMISGVIILFDRPFLVGDRIELLDGTYGDVIDIGLRSTKILTFDNTIDIIPNAELSNQRITNHTYPDIKLKVALTIGVAYGSDIQKVKRIIHEILKENPHVLNVPEWGIWFTEFGDSSLNLFVRYWISDYMNKFDTKDQINMEIKNRFEKENIEIPFPQRDVHVIEKSNKVTESRSGRVTV
ncbi:mechanosensitive ion channel family protein [Candidatus Latescibacterota bacterium]